MGVGGCFEFFSPFHPVDKMSRIHTHRYRSRIWNIKWEISWGQKTSNPCATTKREDLDGSHPCLMAFQLQMTMRCDIWVRSLPRHRSAIQYGNVPLCCMTFKGSYREGSFCKSWDIQRLGLCWQIKDYFGNCERAWYQKLAVQRSSLNCMKCSSPVHFQNTPRLSFSLSLSLSFHSSSGINGSPGACWQNNFLCSEPLSQ